MEYLDEQCKSISYILVVVKTKTNLSSSSGVYLLNTHAGKKEKSKNKRITKKMAVHV